MSILPALSFLNSSWTNHQAQQHLTFLHWPDSAPSLTPLLSLPPSSPFGLHHMIHHVNHHPQLPHPVLTLQPPSRTSTLIQAAVCRLHSCPEYTPELEETIPPRGPLPPRIPALISAGGSRKLAFSSQCPKQPVFLSLTASLPTLHEMPETHTPPPLLSMSGITFSSSLQRKQ